MKKRYLCFLLIALLFVLCFCASTEISEPHILFGQIEKSYGQLKPGLYFDSRSKEWEENYLDADVIESLFGSESNYKEAVENAYIYLSASLSSYEEILVLECYTSDKDRQMTGLLAERDRLLATLEAEGLEAVIGCQGRTVVYCRLADKKRAKEAMPIQ